MKKLIILLLIGAVVMGAFDGGDMTGAVVLAMLTAPMLFGKEGKKTNDRTKKRIYD